MSKVVLAGLLLLICAIDRVVVADDQGLPVLGQESVEIDASSDSDSAEASDERIAARKIRTIANTAVMESPSITATGDNAGQNWPALIKKIRPSVVLVRTPLGFGTGFVVRSDGWILTNQHVIKDAPWDPQTGFQIAKVHMGRDDANGFRLIDEPIWAKVYKSSRQADLALLRLETLPEGMTELPSLSLADEVPPEGADCFAVGMPAAGVLWTVRRGTIAGHGEFPGGLKNALRLGSTEGIDQSKRDALTRILAPDGKRLVTLSTCGINQGDSGGPLTNAKGELVAVTFAVPSDVKDKEFAYHVHLDEVRKFLKDAPPASIQIEPASSIPRVPNCTVFWAKDHRSIGYIVFKRPDDPQVAYYFDADGASVAEISADDILLLDEKEFWKRCGIEWAVTWDPTPTYYFDQNTDGIIDLVFVVSGTVGNQVSKFQLVNGQWEVSKGDPDFLDREVTFDRSAVQARFNAMRHSVLPSHLRR
ncbi:MAG: trypsin-like peptidase domain-containing protein [Pirellulaceae bacterium]|nr:trypsin-like peptidase domain-containing protein [Pirellulaceae bacterium]